MFEVIRDSGEVVLVYRVISTRTGLWFLVYDKNLWTWIPAQTTKPAPNKRQYSTPEDR